MLGVWDEERKISEDGKLSSLVIFGTPSGGGNQETKLTLRHDEMAGMRAESSYDVVVSAEDVSDVDESGWLSFAADDGGSPDTYGSSLSVGDILAGEQVDFWVKCVVPPSQPAGVRHDIYIRVDSSRTGNSLTVDMSKGTYRNCMFTSDGLVFDYAFPSGEWVSDWIDVSSVATGIDFVIPEIYGDNVSISMRTSLGDESSASGWTEDVSHMDLSDSHIQLRAMWVRPSGVSWSGLSRRVYGNIDFSVFRHLDVAGEIPDGYSPGGQWGSPPFSVIWSGSFFAEQPSSYSFTLQGSDGMRLVVDGETVIDDWSTKPFSGGGSISSNIVYGAKDLYGGWHRIEIQYYYADHSEEPLAFNPFVAMTVEIDGSYVPVSLSMFSPINMRPTVDTIRVFYSGAGVRKVDCGIFVGASDTRLISLPKYVSTKEFAPELLAESFNADTVWFEMDTDVSFSSSDYATFSGVKDGYLFSGKSSTGYRPQGQWYWRARSENDGDFGDWSEIREFTILPFMSSPPLMYLHVNVGHEEVDSVNQKRYVYLNENVGLKEFTPDDESRFFFLNANVDLGHGAVVYPIEDRTEGRKEDFDGDDEIFED